MLYNVIGVSGTKLVYPLTKEISAAQKAAFELYEESAECKSPKRFYT